MAVSKAERQELRGIVRQQFRVLKSEVDQREAEMMAEVEERLTQRYLEADRHRGEVEMRVVALLRDCQAKLDTIVEEELAKMDPGDAASGVMRSLTVSAPRLHWDNGERGQYRRALQAEVEAITANAKAQLARQEADLLRDLAMGAIESDAARAFLSTIPTVAQLVPSHRLAELERGLADGTVELPPPDPFEKRRRWDP